MLLRSSYVLGKGGYVFGSVGLSVCGQHYSKSYEWINDLPRPRRSALSECF